MVVLGTRLGKQAILGCVERKDVHVWNVNKQDDAGLVTVADCVSGMSNLFEEWVGPTLVSPLFGDSFEHICHKGSAIYTDQHQTYAEIRLKP